MSTKIEVYGELQDGSHLHSQLSEICFYINELRNDLALLKDLVYQMHGFKKAKDL